MADKTWSVKLMAKGIEQVIEMPALGHHVRTAHQMPNGRIIRNYYRYIRVCQDTKTAIAVFDRSR